MHVPVVKFRQRGDRGTVLRVCFFWFFVVPLFVGFGGTE